jgi:bacteriocin-like protein
MERIMSKNKDTTKVRELNEDELAAVSGGIKDFSFGVVGGYKTAAAEGWGNYKAAQAEGYGN